MTQAELSALRTQAIADAAEIERLRAEIDRLNKACDQRAAHEYKLMGEIDAIKAQNADLLAALQAVVDNADYIDTGHEIAIDALERIKARGDL